MSKYPPTTRRTAGQLERGDTILVRNRHADTLWIEPPRWDSKAHAYVDGTKVAAGVHRIAGTDHFLQMGGRRATRYYRLWLENVDTGAKVTIDISAVQRLNLVVTP